MRDPLSLEVKEKGGDNMLNRKSVIKSISTIVAVTALMINTMAWADPLHSVMLTVPDQPEEALNWCGPATGQMVMEGYPSGACPVLQEDVWVAIQGHKVETMWDTDPAGLQGAMNSLCAPTWSWHVYNRNTPQELMFQVAYWMTANSYPAALLKDTLSHNSYTSHREHWIAVRGVITDIDPTSPGTTSVNLQYVWFNDPAVDLGNPSIERFISGSTWYSEFLPVSKAGSSFQGKYVAVIEPPAITGVALAPPEILVGRIIPPDKALASALRWIKGKKIYELKEYRVLKKARPLQPLLVNKDHGGYYIIPYSTDGINASAAVIVNAYTGGFQEVGVFKPLRYLPKEEAIKIAVRHVEGNATGLNPQAELVLPRGEVVTSRYFPLWKVTVGGKVLGVSQQKHVYTHMPRMEFSIPLPSVKAEGLAWDGKRLWVVDEVSKKIRGLDPLSGAVVRTLDIDIKKPKGLTFDGERIWIADEETMKITAINPRNGQVVRSIPIIIPRGKGFRSLEGITWDGHYLWTAIYAGFSSSYNQVDPEDGKIIKSIYADCNPRGIASDGKYLWSICYNGKDFPPKIDRRSIQGKEHEILRSRKFIADIEGKKPAALAYDGQYLWYTDSQSGRVLRLYPVNVKKK